MFRYGIRIFELMAFAFVLWALAEVLL